ncbi:hypothetical protein ACR9YC_04265 [Parasphingorhabdus sp. DH2-15]|uniref:hypothetical protein n=1 Tax=Parasphingorhabdus sp. DH2-15 TaxID=3444112 RepID=UPI003F6825A0
MIKTQKMGMALALAGASALGLIAAPASAATGVTHSPSSASIAIDRAQIASYFPSALSDNLDQQAQESVEYGRRFRRRRFRRGFRRRGIRGGDILAGILIIGGIAAIADAASNDNNNRRTYPRRDRNQQQRNTRTTTSDINAAADQCANAAEERYGNGSRVNDISRIERADNGFNVQGTIEVQNQLDSFSCGVIGGQIQYLEFGRGQQLLEDQ